MGTSFEPLKSVKAESIERAAKGLVSLIFSSNTSIVRYRDEEVEVASSRVLSVAESSNAFLGMVPDSEVVAVAKEMLSRVVEVLDEQYPDTETQQTS